MPERDTRAPSKRPSGWWDAIGAGASLACLVHCLGLPLLLTLMPAAATLLDVPHDFHVVALAVAVPSSAIAMARGYRHHGVALPALLGAIGLALLCLGTLSGAPLAVETGLTVCGSVILAIAHLRNWRLQRRTRSKPAIDGGCSQGA
ncbi:MAG TPA: MerC domain-containing protein [Sphingomicrobium sp.]|nr:MerC domain-containing protein [Sphingomicrobium sp.]